MSIKTTVLTLALLPALAAPTFAEIPADGEGLAGLYAGSYLCQDGEHGVVLDIAVEERPQASGLKLTGTLGFFPVLGGREGQFAHVAGSFSIQGLVAENGRMTFQHQDWLVEPDGYGAANFNGRITRRDDGFWQITGTPVAGQNADFCSEMIATRFLPQ